MIRIGAGQINHAIFVPKKDFSVRITDVETFHLRGTIEALPDSSMEALVVKITTDSGHVGWGESDGNRAVSAAVVHAPYSSSVVNGLRNILIGENPLDVTRLWKRMYDETIYSGRDGAVIHAMAGCDLALWDLKGKILGVPVNQLLGSSFRDRIPAYASALFADGPKANAALARQIVSDGYGAMKLGWMGFGCGEVEDDLAVLKAIRDAVGYGPRVAVDLGFAWSGRPKEAIRRAKAYEPYKLMWIEEPFAPDDIHNYARMTGSVDTPVTAGEEEASLGGYIRLMDAGIDHIQVDVTKTGLTLAMQVATIAASRGIPCINHNYSNDFNTAASLHFLAAIPNAFILEYGYGTAELARTLVRNPVRVENGIAYVPTGPGLGVEPDLEVMEKHVVGKN